MIFIQVTFQVNTVEICPFDKTLLFNILVSFLQPFVRIKKIIFQIYRNKYKLEKHFNHQKKKIQILVIFRQYFALFRCFKKTL